MRATSRRRALVASGALAVGLVRAFADPFGILSARGLSTEGPSPADVGELYGGFVLVRPGEPRPSVLLPTLGPPILEAFHDGATPTGSSRALDASEAAALGSELPMLQGATITAIGAVFTGTSLFALSTTSSSGTAMVADVAVTWMPHVPKPYVILPQGTPESPILAAKIDDTPSPGLLYRAGAEVVGLWMGADGLRVLVAHLRDAMGEAPQLKIVKGRP